MNTSLRCLFVACGILASAITAQAKDLQDLITAPDLWQTPRLSFPNHQSQYHFTWLSGGHDRAESNAKGVTLCGQRVYETDAEFASGTLSQLTVSIYNHGDAGDITREQMTNLVAQTIEILNKLTTVTGVDLGQDASSAVKAYEFQWKTPATQYTLSYSFTREVKTQSIPFRAEFVRLDLIPTPKARSFLAQALASSSPPQKAFNGPSHVTKNATGDVEIPDVPMVDQGQKGYCVVASTERVMRYYGIPVDEHEMAQLADSSAEMGTNLDAMLTSLKGLSQRLQVKTSEVEREDATQLNELINQYNLRARRAKIQEIYIGQNRTDAADAYGWMRPDLLKAARTFNHGDVDHFQQLVQDQIDKGIPILWSVMFGVVREQSGLSGLGGHMRLITGYNADTHEIIYTDPWGKKFTRERMSADDAWTMTLAMDTVAPLQDSAGQ